MVNGLYKQKSITIALVEDAGALSKRGIKVGHKRSNILSCCEPLVQKRAHVNETWNHWERKPNLLAPSIKNLFNPRSNENTSMAVH